MGVYGTCREVKVYVTLLTRATIERSVVDNAAPNIERAKIPISRSSRMILPLPLCPTQHSFNELSE